MKKAFTAILALTLLVAVVITAMAAPIGINRVTSNASTQQAANLIETTATTVSWNIEAKDGSILVVSGPNGYYYNTQFASKSTPILSTKGLSDGLYTYELILVNNVAVDGTRNIDAPVATLTGAFSMVNGAPLHELDLSDDIDGAGPLPEDQVIADDLIVQFSACVGNDCVNGESFGFDTLRLKENNLRIHFDDTSSSASFPSNDWRIVANDSSNGGANYLSIQDATANTTPFYVAAGSGNNALYVSSSGGNIGMGTASPVVELHIADGDSPAIRLEQNGASGFTPQTWDIAGNETNFFVRDVTNGSKLPFKIKPGAPTNSIYIDTDGDIGLGTASPSERLHVNGGGALISSNTGSTSLTVQETNAAVTARDMLGLENNGTVRFRLTDTSTSNNWLFAAKNTFGVNGNGGHSEMVLGTDGSLVIRDGSFAQAVDGQLLSLLASGNLEIKGSLTENVIFTRPASSETLNSTLNVLDTLANINILSWTVTEQANIYNDEGEIEGVETFTTRRITPDVETFNTSFGIESEGISALRVASVSLAAAQELHAEVSTLQDEVKELQAENAELEARITELEALVNSLIEEMGK